MMGSSTKAVTTGSFSDRNLNNTTITHQQHNICSAGELIEADVQLQASSTNTDETKDDAERKMFEDLSEKFRGVAAGQERMSEVVQRSFAEILEMQKKQAVDAKEEAGKLCGTVGSGPFQANMATQMQFQTQMQITQIMFNMRLVPENKRFKIQCRY